MDKRLSFLIASCTLLLLPSSVWAFSSSSTNYKLEGEFGIFGGAKSSTNYALTDTGGGFAVGFGSSANYGTGSGFQYVLAEVPELVFTISSTSVNLGSLSGTPTSTSNTITVTTNAREGYKVTVLEDGNICRTAQPCNSSNDIGDVAGGTVDPSTEEYGLATSKSGQYFAQDTDCANSPFNATAVDGTARQVASSSLPIDDDQTTLCYSAAISGTTAAGNYSHVLTYIATGTF
ncbi:MAG: hypothetical protein A2113_04235 [Candidatus Woykebacteria bacterium GWA1_44_8]|uniref:Uncharacterized protein n=1 Tax=Candidatus Woykebacteria bacterium GWA1_44_8 TaxID=1802591 RepID=A0A1G1W5A7_9BACT|nr:MAG: hypothetical protein A2113_04235 [Candidatus Woykebacteria bacterium GWA1_44_8]